MWGNLREYLGLARFDRLELSYQVFPGNFVVVAEPGDTSEHHNLASPPPPKKVGFALKRTDRYYRQFLRPRSILPCFSRRVSAH